MGIKIRLRRPKSSRKRKDLLGAPINNSTANPLTSPVDLTAGLGLENLSPEELADLQRSLEDEIHQSDPGAWINAGCHQFTWPKPRGIGPSARDHRSTAVHSCPDIGKGFIAARTAAWWL